MLKIIEFLSNLILTCKSLFKIATGSKCFSQSYFDIQNNQKEIVILANGPSLNDTITQRRQLLENKRLIAVNAFATSSLYEELKPEYYVIADPQFWNNNPIEGVNNFRDKMLDAISLKTSWPLSMFVPYEAKNKTTLFKLLNSNKNIKPIYYNKTTIKGFRHFVNWCFKIGLGIPRPQNVLVPSLILAINMGFRKIYIAGADHSWHETLAIDNDNRLCISQYHFYDKGKVELKPINDIFTGKPTHIHQQFESLAITFRNYHIIEKYACYRKAKIYNASEKSYIDAFERIQLK